MKNLTLLFLFIGISTFAQRPGGRPPGGGNGRPSSARQSSSSTFSMDSNIPKGNSKVTGFVVDSQETTAVEYANIAVTNEENGKVVNGTMADENGKFTFNKMAAGTYTFTISFIGYSDVNIENVEIKKGQDFELGVIKLSLSTQVLDQITVTGVKSLYEEKVDRLIYNAENDISSKGGDGADVLRKVPMLSVDFDGNVSLRGNSNVKVLINNKPSTIVASSVADALKMIPADLIKTVEVITSPSAKYDAEGTTGIINIITKRSTIEGYNLNVNTGIGIRGSNIGLNGNLKAGKFGFSLGGFGRMFYNKADTELNQTTFGTDIITTNQTSNGKDNGLFGRYNLGIDYEFSSNEYITANVSFGTRNFKRNHDYITDLYKNDDFISTQNRSVDSKDISNNVDINLDYIKIFKPSHEWSISTQYSQNNLTNNFDANIYNDFEELIATQNNINENVNKEITVQTDYMVPIGKSQLFEVGAKQIMREVNSHSQYGLSIIENDPTGYLDYNQNISAAYLSYTFSTKNKINFKVGARYEYTSISAEENNIPLEISNYGNLVPSINISKSFENGSTIKLAYNNRISRPGLQQLNPNINAANPLSISIGNPNLKPEISNNVELGISKSFDRNYLNLSIFARQTNNAITRISTPSDTLHGSIITTYENIGVQKALGANIFGNFFINPKWSLNGGIDMYYSYLEGQVQTFDGFETATNSGFTIGGRVMTQISLPKGWGIQGFGGYRGNRISLQGNRSGMGMYSLGFKKDFNEKKGTIGLGVENIFGGMTMKSTLQSDLMVQESINYIHNQNIKLTFSYKLGNMRFVAKKTKSVKNNDVKGGGGNSGGQGGAGMQK